MDRLVKYLSSGSHPIVFEPRSEDYNEIKERLTEMKFIFIKFINTVGETELGINVDSDLTNLEEADYVKGRGNICVVGTCELNYHKVKCMAKIDLLTKTGMAQLEVV